jgi:hypothetical protein
LLQSHLLTVFEVLPDGSLKAKAEAERIRQAEPSRKWKAPPEAGGAWNSDVV